MPERDTTRINERIRVPEVRVIGDDGAQIGILKIDDALKMAQERDLDLVEVAPEAKPPVCRILDYSKYKYEQAQKQKQARKHQTQITIREIKFRPKIAVHDYKTKKGHVTRFLLHKDKVKITIMFRGREVTHPERGKMILDRLAEELEAIGSIEQRPNLDGRNMTMVLGPSKAVINGEITKETWSELAPADDDLDLDAEFDAELEGDDADGGAPEVDGGDEIDVVADGDDVETAAGEESASEPEAAADAGDEAAGEPDAVDGAETAAGEESASEPAVAADAGDEGAGKPDVAADAGDAAAGDPDVAADAGDAAAGEPEPAETPSS